MIHGCGNKCQVPVCFSRSVVLGTFQNFDIGMQPYFGVAHTNSHVYPHINRTNQSIVCKLIRYPLYIIDCRSFLKGIDSEVKMISS